MCMCVNYIDDDCPYCGNTGLEKSFREELLDSKSHICNGYTTIRCTACSYEQSIKNRYNKRKNSTHSKVIHRTEKMPTNGVAIVSEEKILLNSLRVSSADELRAEIERADEHRPDNSAWYILIGVQEMKIDVHGDNLTIDSEFDDLDIDFVLSDETDELYESV